MIQSINFQGLKADDFAKDDEGLQRPDSWLKKQWTVDKVTLWLEDRHGPGRQTGTQPALLQLPLLEIGALLPLYAVIEGSREAAGKEPLQGTVDFMLPDMQLKLTPPHIGRLHHLAVAAKSFSTGRGHNENF